MVHLTETLENAMLLNLSPMPVSNGIPILEYYRVRDNRFNIIGGEFSFMESIEGTTNLVASCHLTFFPKCKGIAILTNVYVVDAYRGRGMGTFMVQYIAWLSRNLNFSLSTCTARSDNTPMRKVLDKCGYEPLIDFHNDKTTNDVTLFSLNLKGHEQFCGIPVNSKTILSIL